MSRRAQCLDNAPAESFCATKKQETLQLNAYFNSRAEVRSEVKEWIFHYHGKRPDSN